jgi:hypothetical protein
VSKGSERRQFERIPVALDWGEVQPLLGALIHWPNHETSPVFDMSYFGLAAGRPALFKAEPNQSHSVQLELGKEPLLPVQARIAWCKDKLVGLELKPLNIVARQVFDEFFEDRLIGKNLRRIDRRYYAAGSDFSVWYHGPLDTNVFLWQENGSDEVRRAEIELDGRILIFDGQQIISGGASPRTSLEPVEENELILEKSLPLVKRVMSILSQVDEPRGPMRSFLIQLAKVGL